MPDDKTTELADVALEQATKAAQDLNVDAALDWLRLAQMARDFDRVDALGNFVRH